jgi:hypothetical protein
MKIFILTQEYNAYDQYGEYFIAAFRTYPSLEQLSEYDCYHLGRQNYEDSWFNLQEVIV